MAAAGVAQNGHNGVVEPQDAVYVLSPEAGATSSTSTGTHTAAGGEQALDLSNAGPLTTPELRCKQHASTRQDTFSFEQSTHDEFYNAISPALKRGTAMLKVSAKKVQRRLVRIKPEAGQLLWESKHAGIREF